MLKDYDDIVLLQELLGLVLPRTYKEAIWAGERTGEGYEMPLAGLPISLDLDSAWGATEFVRAARPDLPPSYIAITFENDKVLCLDLEKGGNEDAPVVEVRLEGSDPPAKRYDSFTDFFRSVAGFANASPKTTVRQPKDSDQWFHYGLEHLDWHMTHIRFHYDHEKGGQLSRNHLWRPYRFCVQDVILGITVIRHDRVYNRLLVDVFLTAEIPEYESDSGCRALALILLSDAHKSGGSMEIKFTKHVEGGKVPQELMKLGEKYGVTFKQASLGGITPMEAKQFFMALSGFNDKIIERVAALDKSGKLSTAGVCYAMHHGVWTKEDLDVLLFLSRSPESLLTGRYSPACWHLYLHDLLIGRTAMMGSYLDRQLLTREYVDADNGVIELEDNEQSVAITFDPEVCAKNYSLVQEDASITVPWIGCGKNECSLFPNETLHVLLRARGAEDLSRKFGTDLELAVDLRNRTKSSVCILVPADFKRLGPEMLSRFGQAAREAGVSIIICPEFVNQLDQEVARRFEAVKLMKN